MVNRDYIINRIKSRGVTLGEFDFDRLQAPRIMDLLSPYDVNNLHEIAHSIRLSAQYQKKYQLIDKILIPRGFVKLVAGTNRVCYRYIEDQSFVLKVAIDDIGMRDNPCEFKNQFVFKPFVTKIFEVSPCGTVGLAERVTPITNIEEFMAVADDIYAVINEIFVGEYVLADFGTKFFMNWGLREAKNGMKAFGPVLLDFPYIYKLDGKKLFCNCIDPHSETGYCGGAIDYDSGYNFLVCTRCGKHYKASDLAMTGEHRKIIIKESGGYKMKISVSGGTKSVSKTIRVGDNGVAEEVNVMPVRPTVQSAPKVVKEEEPVEEKVVEREIPNEKNNMAVNGVTTEKEDKKEGAISPIKVVSEEEKMKTMDSIVQKINEIRSMSGLLNDDENNDLIDMLNDLIDELDRDLSSDDEDSDCKEPMYNGFTYMSGAVTNVKDVDPNLESKKVIVITDSNGNYLVDVDYNIVAIDTLDNHAVNNLAVVSQKWMNDIKAQLESQENNDNIEDDIEDETVETVGGSEEE